MLAAVAPFALEKGLLSSDALAPQAGESAVQKVTIHSLNTGATYEALVPMTATSDSSDGDAGQVKRAVSVQYSGDFEVPGIPGGAAPVQLASLGVAGSQTGKLLPTGRAKDFFRVGTYTDPVAVTLIDFARALVVVHAEEVLPKFGYRSLDDLSISQVEQDTILCTFLEDLRLQAGLAMGMGDCSGHDAPKLAIVDSAGGSRGQLGAAFACRYFVQPGRREMHPTIAMTAAQALGAASLVEDSVARTALDRRPESDANAPDVFTFSIQHAKGTFPVSIGTQPASADESATFSFGVPYAGRYTTTVMPIAEGTAFIGS